MKQISEGIFSHNGKLYTINLVPGTKVYGEQLVQKEKEYREWDPTRSKLAAAIVNGAKNIPFKEGLIIFYLGASTGTTVSHISDIIGHEGLIYGLEFAERVFRNFISITKQRNNIAPIFADARMPEKYSWIELCDVVYCDIAQPDQTMIALRNAEMFLKERGFLFVSVKSRSIDVTKDPKKLYKEESEKVRSAGYKVLEVIDLEPHEDSHAMIIAQKN